MCLTLSLIAGFAAVTGELIDLRDFAAAHDIDAPDIALPADYRGRKMDFLATLDRGGALRKGPNIGELPRKEPLKPTPSGDVLLKMGPNVTTDHIRPEFLP